MKKYMKPALEAVDMVTEISTMEGLSVVTSVSAQGAGSVKGEVQNDGEGGAWDTSDLWN